MNDCKLLMPTYFLFLLFLAFSCAQNKEFRSAVAKDAVPHFELVSEDVIDNCCISGLIVIKDEDFSEKNIEHIFLSFSRKHNNLDQVVAASVYVQASLKKYGNKNLKTLITDANEGKIPQILPVASFVRTVPTDMGRLYRESFLLNPTPGDYLNRRFSLMAGEPTMEGRKELNAWNTSNKALEIRTTAFTFDESNISETAKNYFYTFDVRALGEEHWRKVLTVRHNVSDAINPSSVRFVNDNIAYVFVADWLAVTMDAGKSWRKWNIARHWENWQCCKNYLIVNVDINADGYGNMTLQAGANSNFVLLTKDYGFHWTES